MADGTRYELLATIGAPAKAQQHTFNLNWGWWGKSWPAEPAAPLEVPENALHSLQFALGGKPVHLPQKFVQDLCEVRDIIVIPSATGKAAKIEITGSDGGEAYRVSLVVVGGFLRERLVQSVTTPVSEHTILKWNE